MKKTRIEDFSPKELAKLRKGRKGSAWQISSVAFAFLFALLAVTFSLLAFDNEGDEGLKIPAYAFFALAGVALAIFFIPKYFPKSWVRSLNRSLYRGIFSSDLQDFDFPVDKDLLVERGLEDQVLREVGQDARFDYGSTSVTIVDVVKTMSARDALEREAKGEGDSAAFLDRFASPFAGR